MIYLVCVFAYLLLLAGIGIRQSRRVKSEEDFTVAGRSLSPWVMVCTMLAVWIGTGSIVVSLLTKEKACQKDVAEPAV